MSPTHALRTMSLELANIADFNVVPTFTGPIAIHIAKEYKWALNVLLQYLNSYEQKTSS